MKVRDSVHSRAEKGHIIVVFVIVEVVRSPLTARLQQTRSQLLSVPLYKKILCPLNIWLFLMTLNNLLPVDPS